MNFMISQVFDKLLIDEIFSLTKLLIIFFLKNTEPVSKNSNISMVKIEQIGMN